ncbi:MAG TPA: NAD(P)/FAD-dependent oxidoreductase [Candidatus Limnocylindrales bacterium]|nr:NAD(P)/FAD-dependent oxidoreductase [Candidatus Limnocylindrales bacterium]
MTVVGGGYDAIVVGGGHNGLTCAAYLARAGLGVLVLERRERVGGIADTVEIAPVVRSPAIAATVGRLRASVARDLDLRAHGLSLVAPAVRVFAPGHDGSAVVLWADVDRTAEDLRRRGLTADADAWSEFDRLVRSLGGFMADLGEQTPPDIANPGVADALGGLLLGRKYRGLGRLDARTILRVLAMPVADFVAESLVSDALRAAVAWRGVRNASLGPWSAGSTLNLLQDAAGNDGGAAGETVFARGGPGALAEALASAARSFGAVIRTEAEVVAVRSNPDGVATGVVLASGEEIAARAVVSAVDPKQTLLRFVDPIALGPTLRWRAGNIRQPGVVATVALALSRLPSFSAADGDERLLRGRILVGAEGVDALERAFDAAKYGRISERPVVEATIPSLVDPSLVDGAEPGTHVLHAHVQWTPRELRDGDWEACREPLADSLIAQLETVAPGIGGLVTARRVLTPLDLERDYGLSSGHPWHAEPALESFFLWRPMLGYARYRMPLRGLYLAGSGAHPGGGITGGPGQNAAREIVKDLRSRI